MPERNSYYRNEGRRSYSSDRSYNSDRGYRRSSDRDDDFRFEIVDRFGVITTSKNGWTKELNRVSWNGMEPKYDVREWSPDHEKMRRGVTFTEDEAIELLDLLEYALEGKLPSRVSSDELMDKERMNAETNQPYLPDAGPLVEEADAVELSA